MNIEAKGVDESYIAANNTSNLRVESERRGSADVLIAAGWSASRLGAALMRLHSEYDGRSRPINSGATDDRLMMGGLKSLGGVIERMEHEAALLGFESPKLEAFKAVAWWLSKTCGGCQGRKYQVMLGTPSLTTKPCMSCGGTGENALSGKTKKLVIFMDDCVARARDSIKKRLRHNQV